MRAPDDTGVTIPPGELQIEVSTARGPGGQNVNRVRTRVTVSFDLEATRILSEEQKRRVRQRLGSRITRRGILKVRSEQHRTQARNRQAAEARLRDLIAGALQREAPRLPTEPTAASARRRMEEKKRRSGVKRNRSRPFPEE